MKRNWKKARRIISLLTVCCLAFTMLTVTAFAASSRTLFADFEGTSSLPETTASSYGISPNGMKKNTAGNSESTVAVEQTADANGNETDALHFYWKDAESPEAKETGADPFVSINNATYDGAKITSFDFKLDNAASRFSATYRINDTPAQWITFITAQQDRNFTLFDKEISLTAESDKWYHVTIKTEYDAEAGAVKGSAWIDGELLADGISVLTIEETKLAQSANIFRFRSDDRRSGSLKDNPGIWLDNITVDNPGSASVVTTPKNNASVTDGRVNFLFGADIDESTLDISKVTVTKDRVKLDVTPSFNYNRLSLNVGEIEASEYTVTLPSGVKDIFGTEFSDADLSVTFKGIAAQKAEFKITSPADGSVLTRGEPVVIKAAADADMSADFYFGETKINDSAITADSNGILTYTWTPDKCGDMNLTVRTADGAKTSEGIGINVMKPEQEYTMGSGSGSYEGKENVITVESGKSIDNSNLSITSGIYELVFDAYTDASGNGAWASPMVKYTDGGNKSWWSMIAMTNGKVTVNNAEKTVCAANSWYRVRMVFDIDSQTGSIYLNGEQIASGISLAESGKTVNSLYRIKIENGKNTVYYTMPKINRLSEVNPGVSITSLTDGAVLENGQPIVLKAEFIEVSAESAEVTFYKGGETIGTGEKQSDGSFTYLWTPTDKGSARISAVAEINGEKYISKEIKVNVLGASSTSVTATKSLAVNSGDVIINGESVTSDKWGINSSDKVTMTRTAKAGGGNNDAPYTQMNISEAKASGYFAVEADVTVTAGGKFMIMNRNDGSSNKSFNIVTLNSGVVYVCKNNSSNSYGADVASSVTYTEGEKVHVKAVLDLSERTIYIYINGVLIPERGAFRSDFQDVKMIRFGSYNVGKAVTVQNETARYIPSDAKVTGISVNGEDGSALTVLRASDIKNITVTYDSAMSAPGADSVKLYRGSGNGAEIGAAASLSDDKKSIIVTPSAALESSAMYRLVISDISSTEGAQASDVNYSFRTVNEGRGASNGVFKKNSEIISSPVGLKIGDKISFTADITGNIAETDIWVVLVVYENDENGKVLKDVSVTVNDLPGLNAPVAGELTLTSDISDGDTVFAYVWSNDMFPFSDEFPLQASK